MSNLEDMFHNLQAREQRDLASAKPHEDMIPRARRTRIRNRALQATGGTLAVGALSLGAVQVLPTGTGSLEAASSPTGVAVETTDSAGEATENEAAATGATAATTVVTFDDLKWSASDNVALQRIESEFQCNGPAPTPTAGVATITLDDLRVRDTEFVINMNPGAGGSAESTSEPGLDGSWSDDLAAQASVVSTSGDTLYSDLTASAILFVKDGEIVEIFGANYINPGEELREVHAPEGYDGNIVGPETETESGIAAVLTDQATTLITGYSAWDCVPGSGSVDFGPEAITHHAPADFLESGDYQAYLVAEVNVDEQAAALHELNDLGVDLWNGWTLDQQLDDLGLDHHTVSNEDDDYDYRYIEVPVPTDTIPAQDTSELIVSEAITVTIP